jgi:hypothetical protein
MIKPSVLGVLCYLISYRKMQSSLQKSPQIPYHFLLAMHTHSEPKIKAMNSTGN